jgi:hypothetical protein
MPVGVHRGSKTRCIWRVHGAGGWSPAGAPQRVSFFVFFSLQIQRYGRIATMPSLVKIAFSAEGASVHVQNKNKGHRSTTRHNTKGVNHGKDPVSLWRELCNIMLKKKLAVCGPTSLFVPFSYFVSSLFLQTEKELTPIRTALGAEKLPLLSDVCKIWRGKIQASTIISLY